jgi:hypothetical protein
LWGSEACNPSSQLCNYNGAGIEKRHLHASQTISRLCLRTTPHTHRHTRLRSKTPCRTCLRAACQFRLRTGFDVGVTPLHVLVPMHRSRTAGMDIHHVDKALRRGPTSAKNVRDAVTTLTAEHWRTAETTAQPQQDASSWPIARAPQVLTAPL